MLWNKTLNIKEIRTHIWIYMISVFLLNYLCRLFNVKYVYAYVFYVLYLIKKGVLSLLKLTVWSTHGHPNSCDWRWWLINHSLSYLTRWKLNEPIETIIIFNGAISPCFFNFMHFKEYKKTCGWIETFGEMFGMFLYPHFGWGKITE